jgi:hypothetical protein
MTLIQNNPTTAKDVDFAVMQKRLDILETNQKLKNLEMTDGLKRMSAGVGMNMNGNIGWEKEKQKYLEIIRKKNRDIAVCRDQLDGLLLQIEDLKNNKGRHGGGKGVY